MKTTSAICYAPWEMKAEYADGFSYSNDPIIRHPIDFGAIDAPDIIPAGSTYSYKRLYRDGYFPMPSHISRP